MPNSELDHMIDPIDSWHKFWSPLEVIFKVSVGWGEYCFNAISRFNCRDFQLYEIVPLRSGVGKSTYVDFLKQTQFVQSPTCYMSRGGSHAAG